MLDIDAPGGDTVVSVEYPHGTRASKVLSDIRQYFKDGTVPQISELAQFRYSLKEGTISKSYEALLRENAALRERVDYWKGQTRRTDRVTTDKKAVEKAARDLIRRYGAEVELEDIRGGMQSLFDYISSGSDGKNELTYTEARRRAESIARTLVENAVAVDDGLYQDHRDLRKHLRNTKLNISESDSRDIPGFNEFRKRNFGRLNIGKGRTNIDQAYRELAELWPGLFNEQEYSHPADQLYHIAEVLDAVSAVETYNPFSGDLRNAVAGAANEIMELFFDLPQTRATFADRQAQKQDKLRAQNRKLVQQAIERERAVRDRQIKRLQDHYARVQRDRAERQADSAARTRLLNIARDKGCDMIIGYIANDRMFFVLDRFFNGEITDLALINSLSALKLGKQYVALTEKACKKIEVLDERQLTESDRDRLKQESGENRSKGIAMAGEICRKYRRDGRFFDEILKAGE